MAVLSEAYSPISHPNRAWYSLAPLGGDERQIIAPAIVAVIHDAKACFEQLFQAFRCRFELG